MGMGLFCKKHDEYSQSGECRWCEPPATPKTDPFGQALPTRAPDRWAGLKSGMALQATAGQPMTLQPEKRAWWAQLAASGTANIPAYYLDTTPTAYYLGTPTYTYCPHTEWQPAVNMDADTCKGCGWLRTNTKKAADAPCSCRQYASMAKMSTWYDGSGRYHSKAFCGDKRPA